MLESTFLLSWSQFFIVAAVILIAHLVNVLLGFGAGVLMISCLALLYGDQLAQFVVLLLILRMPIEAVIVWRSRRSINFSNIPVLYAGLVLGVIFGSYFLVRGEDLHLLAALGVLVVILGAYFMFFAKRFLPPPMGHKASFVIGSIGGFFAGLYGAGGPPVVLYFKSQRLDKKSFRSNLMITLLLIQAMRLVSYIYYEVISTKILISMVLLVPFAILGAWIGNLWHLHVAEEKFQNLVSVALIVMGAILIAKVL